MFEGIVGHSLALRILKRSFVTGRLSHAYLFIGPPGVGKAKVARTFAATVVGGEKWASHLHPDISEVHPTGSSFRLSQIRELIAHASLAPAQGERKVYILHNVETFTAEAANSLLRTLEEPSNAVCFILLADKPQVTSTIVSRCQVLRFGYLTVPETVSVLKSVYPQAGGLTEVARMSFGSPGEAVRLLEPGAILRQQEMAALAERILELTGSEKLEWMTRLEEHKDDLHVYVAFLALWVRDVLCFKLGLVDHLALPYRAEVEAQAQRTELTAIVARLSSLQEMLAGWGASTNKRLVLDQLFLQFH